jgi:hypothetical protein
MLAEAASLLPPHLNGCAGDGWGQEAPAATAESSGPGSTLVVRSCELCAPAPVSEATPFPRRGRPLQSAHASLLVRGGARATAADCACGGQAVVVNQGSVLLHSGLAFLPGLMGPILYDDGGVVRMLPAAAGGAGGSRAGAPAPRAARV